MTGPVVGVDIGGSKTSLAVVLPDGTIVGRGRYPTPTDEPPDHSIERLADEVRALAGGKVAAVGVGICGQVTRRSGTVRGSPNLPRWNDVPLQARLGEALGVPVAVANDVQTIALGEWRYGTDPDVDDLVVVFVGTGIGGGIVSGGRLLRGHRGHAGEIGHATLVAGGRRCSCGNRGCLEAYAGGWAIAERARQACEDDPEAGAALVGLAGSVERITGRTVAEARRRNDPLARRLVEETGRLLGAGLVGVINAFNPRRLVLGGGILEGIPDLLELARSHATSHALPAAVDTLEIESARLGADAGMLGAAVLVRGASKDA